MNWEALLARKMSRRKAIPVIAGMTAALGACGPAAPSVPDNGPKPAYVPRPGETPATPPTVAKPTEAPKPAPTAIAPAPAAPTEPVKVVFSPTPPQKPAAEQKPSTRIASAKEQAIKDAADALKIPPSQHEQNLWKRMYELKDATTQVTIDPLVRAHANITDIKSAMENSDNEKLSTTIKDLKREGIDILPFSEKDMRLRPYFDDVMISFYPVGNRLQYQLEVAYGEKGATLNPETLAFRILGWAEMIRQYKEIETANSDLPIRQRGNKVEEEVNKNIEVLHNNSLKLQAEAFLTHIALLNVPANSITQNSQGYFPDLAYAYLTCKDDARCLVDAARRNMQPPALPKPSIESRV